MLALWTLYLVFDSESPLIMNDKLHNFNLQMVKNKFKKGHLGKMGLLHVPQAYDTNGLDDFNCCKGETVVEELVSVFLIYSPCYRIIIAGESI